MAEDEKPEKLTFWQKLKRITGAIVAISGLLAILGGPSLWSWSKDQTQDKVQESAYTLLAERVEELYTEQRVMKETIRHLEKKHDVILSKELIRSRMMMEAIEEMEPMSGEVAMMVESDISEEDEPEPAPEIEYEGVAKLPRYDNIQRVVKFSGEMVGKK